MCSTHICYRGQCYSDSEYGVQMAASLFALDECEAANANSDSEYDVQAAASLFDYEASDGEDNLDTAAATATARLGDSPSHPIDVDAEDDGFGMPPMNSFFQGSSDDSSLDIGPGDTADAMCVSSGDEDDSSKSSDEVTLAAAHAAWLSDQQNIGEILQ